MQTQQLSPLGLYGNKDVFTDRYNDGAREVAFGSGGWVTSFGEAEVLGITAERIAALWVFYYPSGLVALRVFPKGEYMGMTIRGCPYEIDLWEEDFQQFPMITSCSISERKNLAEVMGG